MVGVDVPCDIDPRNDDRLLSEKRYIHVLIMHVGEGKRGRMVSLQYGS